MYIKQGFMNRIERIKLQCRGIGMPMLIPLFFNYVILPLSVFILASSGDYQGAEEYAWRLSFLFIPIMSVWWVILVMERSLEEQGELFYLYEQRKWVDVLLYCLAYFLLITPLCLFFMNQWPDEFYPEDFITLFTQCFFSVCLVYLLCMMTKSVVISFVTILAFTLYIDGRIYYILERYGVENWTSGGGYCIAGILCLLLGMTFQRPK